MRARKISTDFTLFLVHIPKKGEGERKGEFRYVSKNISQARHIRREGSASVYRIAFRKIGRIDAKPRIVMARVRPRFAVGTAGVIN